MHNIFPKVSVILPIYNGEKTLVRTLESLLAQTYQNFELVACIDGSNDNSINILQNFKDKFKRTIVLINENNLGLGPTMNRLVANSKGEYIAVAEQDDYYYPNRLASQVEVFESNPNVGLVSGIADFFDGNKIVMQFPGMLVNGYQYPKKEEMFLLNYRNQIKVVNSAMMLKKTTHIDHGLYFTKHYPSVSVDWAYILRFSLVSDIYGLSESLVLLDRSNDRNSVTTNKQKQFLAARELIRSFYYEFPHLISKNDYKYAMTTQHLLELASLDIYQFPLSFARFYMLNPWDKRWRVYLLKRIKRFLK